MAVGSTLEGFRRLIELYSKTKFDNEIMCSIRVAIRISFDILALYEVNSHLEAVSVLVAVVEYVCTDRDVVE